MLTSSLSSALRWDQILPLLGTPVTGAALPAQLACPICRRHQLDVFSVSADYQTDAAWTYCHRCRAAGDLLHLASRKWRLSPEAAVLRLQQQGVPVATDSESLRRLTQEGPAHWQRPLQLWEQAQQNHPHNSATVENLLHELKLATGLTWERWRKGPGQLLGVVPKDAVERCFLPKTMESAAKTGRSRPPSARRSFVGTGWDDVLAVPFFYLPGWIGAFQFVGRQGRPEDFVLRHTAGIKQEPDPLLQRNCREGGLAYHPDVPLAAKDWKNTVIATSDLLLMLRLQCRNFDESLLPLPMVTWLEKEGAYNTVLRTRRAWDAFYRQRVVLWAPFMDAATIRQLLTTNLQISRWKPDNADTPELLRELLMRESPVDVVRKILKAAKPWETDLATYLGSIPTSDAEGLMYELSLSGTNLQHLLQRCPAHTASLVLHVVSRDQPKRTLMHRKTQISEDDAGWHADNKGEVELISDAKLEIRHIVRFHDSPGMYFEGVVVYQHQELPFCVPRATLESSPLQWMQDFVLQQGRGYVRCARRWDSHILEIATQFHPPVVVTGYRRVGWDQEQQRFVFPSFALTSTGDLEVFPTAFVTREHPTRTLEPPRAVSPETLYGPDADRAAGPYWAAFVALLSNILAPPFRRRRSGVVLAGQSATSIGWSVAEVLGCPVLRDFYDSPTLAEKEWENAWPIAVTLPDTQPAASYHTWLSETPPRGRNAVVCANGLASHVYSLNGGWNVVQGDAALVMPADILARTGEVLMAYLQDLCRRRLTLQLGEEAPECWFEEVLYDFAAFVKAQHGDPARILLARNYVLPDQAASLSDVAALLTGCVHARKLAVSCKKKGYDFLTRCDNDTIFLPQHALTVISRKLAAPAIDIERFLAALSDGKVLISQDEQGWFLDASWFDYQLKQTGLDQRFGIVG